jgi:hypothetical protein
VRFGFAFPLGFEYEEIAGGKENVTELVSILLERSWDTREDFFKTGIR